MNKKNKPDVNKKTRGKANVESPDPSTRLHANLPVAEITDSRMNQIARLTGSYMWLITLLCLAIAIGLVWWSLPNQGIEIDVHFPDGHGLEAEDTVRYRGIDVGIVDRVELNDALSGVDVAITLKPFAESLACEGTRFWVVRPELSLAGISGLETAVGHKYIGLIPGDANSTAKHTFDGLASAPPDALATGGMEIIIRGQRKHSVSTGSPVTCRGVEVGRILSVGLSQDARFVDIRARIFQNFTPLITSKTKFWATSGVDFDFSFGEGMKLDIESLETIARGGVSMLTIENNGRVAKPGDVFTLESKPEDDWYKKAALVRSTDVELHGVLPLEISWQHDGLLGDKTKQTTFNGIPLRLNGETIALVPADMLRLPNKGRDGSQLIAPVGFRGQPILLPGNENDGNDGAVDELQGGETQGEEVQGNAEQSTLFQLPVPDSFSSEWLDPSAIRIPEIVEHCLVVRATGNPQQLTYLHYPLDKADISDADGNWIVSSFDGDRDVWHGSPVLAASDGKLIGMLLISKRQTMIARPLIAE